MANGPIFTIKIQPDIQQPGRHRWCIIENGQVRDNSTYSYATKREAQADADKFLQKLNATWRTHE